MERNVLSGWIASLNKNITGPTKRKVLAIDDDENVLELLRCRFERLRGYDIYTSVSGEDGYEIAKRHKPDLIVLDWVMPSCSGLATLRRLKNNPTTKDIPVLMLTGKTLFKDAEKALAAGATGYVTKPIKPSQLFMQISRLSRGERPVYQAVAG